MPASAHSSAAASPASPPPTTAICRHHAHPPDEASRQHPALLPRTERRPCGKDDRRLLGDPLQDASIRPAHREHRGGASPVEERHEPEPALQPPEPALRLERDDELGIALDAAVADDAAEPRKILGRQIHAAVRQVVGKVAQDVADLQPDAEIVRERLRGDAVGSVEEAEREPPDRAGDATAVPLELGERCVLGPAHVVLGAVDQVLERDQRHGETRSGVRDRDEDRIVALVDTRELGADIAQLGEPLLRGQRAVGHVVDAPCECVDREQAVATVGREQPDAGVEARAGSRVRCGGIRRSSPPGRVSRRPSQCPRDGSGTPSPTRPRRGGQHLVLRSDERIGGRSAAADESGKREARAPAHEPYERRALIEERLCARDLERQQPAERLRHRRRREVVVANAEAVEILLRQVHAAGASILAHVLPVLDQLQRGAHRVRQRDALRGRLPEHVQHELADRVGGQRQ